MAVKTFSLFVCWICIFGCQATTKTAERKESSDNGSKVSVSRSSRIFLTPLYHWSPWNSWSHSTCSRPCGGGTKQRHRKCLLPNNVQTDVNRCMMLYFNQKATQWKACHEHPCANVASWSDWQTWSHCSGSCGAGLKIRFRKCGDGTHVLGAHNCSGDGMQKQTCHHSNGCPVNGNWSGWSSWSSCSHSCGRGIHFRKRSCDHPSPTNGGQTCIGDSTQTQGCHMPDCPVLGWAQWGVWSRCSGSCGGGIQLRIRSCSHPNSQYCQGQTLERRTCNHQQSCTLSVSSSSTRATTMSVRSTTTTTNIASTSATTAMSFTSKTTAKIKNTCADHPLCFDPKTVSIACSDTYIATSYCPKMCGLCALPTTPSVPPTTSSVNSCIDHALCLDPKTKPIACSDAYLATSYCPKMCGLCGA